MARAVAVAAQRAGGQARAKGAGKPAKGKGGALWMQGAACGALLAFATPTAMLCGVLLAPGLLCLVIEAGPRRPIARAMMFSGMAFTLAPEWRLVGAGHSMSASLALLQDPAVLLPPWIAAAVGWSLCEVLPVLYRATAEVRARARLAALEAEEKALRDAWDLPGE